MNKVGIYCRTSTEEQRLGKTIQSQISELEKYAKSNGLDIVDRYIDDGWTGSILERPELDRLRDDIKFHKFNQVLLLHPDRLSRVQLHQLLLLDEFEKNGAKIIFYNLPDYSEQSEESQVVNKSVWSMVSDLERLRIRERTRRGKRNKAERGFVVGHIAPYGYKYVKPLSKREKGHYVLNENEAKNVKLIFQLAKQGLSGREIIKKLAELKISRRNPSRNKTKPNWCWTNSTIYKILKNETYTGITYFNKYESVEAKNPTAIKKYRRVNKTSRKLREKDKWIPINLPSELHLISKDEFNIINAQLEKNRQFSKRNTKHDYLLRGLVYCKKCNSLLYADCSHGKSFYKCSYEDKQFPLLNKCQNGQVSSNVIEPFVWTILKQLLLNPKLILKEAEYHESHKENNTDKNNVKITLDSIDEKEKRILDGYREGIITIEQLRLQMNEIKNERKLVPVMEEKPKKIQINLVSMGIKKLCRQLIKVIDKLKFDERQMILRRIFTKITYDKKQIEIEGILPVIPLEPNFQIASTTSS